MGSGLPFRPERLENGNYAFMHFDRRLGGEIEPKKPIETGEQLLRRMRTWSLVDIDKVIDIVKSYKAELIIDNDGFLSVRFSDELLSSINNAFYNMHYGQPNKCAEIGLPRRIWPDFDESRS